MTIREWLSDPSNFEAGRQLYEKHGSSTSLKNLMRRGGDTKRNRETLIYELGKLKDKDAQAHTAPTVKAPEVIREWGRGNGKSVFVELQASDIIKEQEVAYHPEADHQVNDEAPVRHVQHSPPDQILQLEKEWKDLFKISNHKKTTLSSMDPEERRKAVLYILDTFDLKIHPLWKKVDYFREHGQLPPEEIIEEKPMDAVSMVNRRNTLRSYVTKANKGLLRPEKIPEWQAEIDKIEEQLKQLKTT